MTIKWLAPLRSRAHVYLVAARSVAFIGDENASSAPAFLLRNGAAPWSDAVSYHPHPPHWVSAWRKRRSVFEKKREAPRQVSNASGLSGAPGTPRQPCTFRPGLDLPACKRPNSLRSSLRRFEQSADFPVLIKRRWECLPCDQKTNVWNSRCGFCDIADWRAELPTKSF